MHCWLGIMIFFSKTFQNQPWVFDDLMWIHVVYRLHKKVSTCFNRCPSVLQQQNWSQVSVALTAQELKCNALGLQKVGRHPGAFGSEVVKGLRRSTILIMSDARRVEVVVDLSNWASVPPTLCWNCLQLQPQHFMIYIYSATWWIHMLNI